VAIAPDQPGFFLPADMGDYLGTKSIRAFFIMAPDVKKIAVGEAYIDTGEMRLSA